MDPPDEGVLPDDDDMDGVEGTILDTGQGSPSDNDHTPSSVYTGVTPTKTRVRQYPRGHKGPFVVHIRKLTEPLKHVQIARDLNSKLKSVQSCMKRSPDKLTVTLLDVKEANAIPSLKCLEKYHVYIPADDVEVAGVFDLPPEILLKEIQANGVGKFSHPDVPSVRPVDLYRFKRHVPLPNGETMEQDTNSVKVTFPGKALPQYMLIYNLLVRIRPYDRKAMFCNNCCSINHTEKFCSKKACCLKCGQEHMTKDCPSSVEQTVCKLCKETHSPDIRQCPRYLQASKNRKAKQTQSIKDSYAQIVNQHNHSDNQAQMRNFFAPLSEGTADEGNCQESSQYVQYANPSKRHRPSANSDSAPGNKAVLESPTRRKTSTASSTARPMTRIPRDPPGFKKSDDRDSQFSSYKAIVRSLLGSLNINPQFLPLINTCIELFFDTVLPFLIQNVFSLQTNEKNYES